MFPIRSTSHHLPQLGLQGPAVAVRGGLAEIFKALQASEEGWIVPQNLLDLVQGREVLEGFMVRGGNILDTARLLMNEIVVKTRWFGFKT